MKQTEDKTQEILIKAIEVSRKLSELETKQSEFLMKIIPEYAKAYPEKATEVYTELKAITLVKLPAVTDWVNLEQDYERYLDNIR